MCSPHLKITFCCQTAENVKALLGHLDPVGVHTSQVNLGAELRVGLL